MKGLLIKDFKLLMGQKYFVIAIVMICVWFLAMGRNPATVGSYLSIVMAIFAGSTISYDEYENGMMYLFTFPIRRRDYVLAKYMFGIALLALTVAVGSVLMFTVALASPMSYEAEQWVSMILTSVLGAALIQAVSIPVQLKFGGEKSRVALVIVCAGIVLAVYTVNKAGEAMQVDFEAVIQRIAQASPAVFCMCSIAAALLVMGISCLISLAVMKRKQF